MQKLIFSLAALLALGTTSAQADPDEHHGHMQGKMAHKMFKEVDTNADGEISKTEFDAFHALRFKELDGNGDGKLTKEEVDALHAKR